MSVCVPFETLEAETIQERFELTHGEMDDSALQFSLEAVRPTRWTMSVLTKRASMVADCAHLVDEKFFEQIRNSPIFPAQ